MPSAWPGCWWKRASASSPAAAPASWKRPTRALPRRLHIELPHEQGCNQYVKTRCNFRYFFTRKFMFVKYAMAYVVMPGGMGTIDELSEAFVLAQTRRIRPFPIILYNSSYWSGLLEWLRTSMANGGFINREEIDKLVTVCDTPEQVVEHLCKIVIL